MPSTAGLPVRTLNLHQGYQCRHSGVCCSAGWDVPIDHDRFVRVSDAVAGGILQPGTCGTGTGAPFVRDSLPDGEVAILARTASGDCVFFDRSAGRLCAIHRVLGHEWLPTACRHFPRVILLDDQGIDVAFSHVCPTAADQLFRDDIEQLTVVVDPAILADPGHAEGFDARGTVPPFVKPGTVFDPESRLAWETFLLGACSRADEPPWSVIARLAAGANRFRAWTPGCGAMGPFARDVLARVLDAAAIDARADETSVTALYTQVIRTVPEECAPPSVPDGAEFVADPWRTWPASWRTVNRYLGCRAFGAWSTYRGEGVRTQVAMLAAALAALGVEVIRRRSPDGTNDPAILRDALRAADLVTVHQSDDAVVCRTLRRVETMTPPAFMASLGVTGV